MAEKVDPGAGDPRAALAALDRTRDLRSTAGPADRVTFYEEQRKRRHATWRLTLVCLLIAAAMGIILSAIVSPLVLAIAAAALKFAAAHGPHPELAENAVRVILRAVVGRAALIDDIERTLDRAQGVAGLALLLPLLLRFSVLLLPGMAVTALAWWGFRALVLRSGMAGFLTKLGARPVRTGDPEERQLVNIVEEIAIASGIPAPRVMLIDVPEANAAALGPSHRDAAVLATRGLLDRLDRDETQAVLAHVMGSIGNGDLKVTASILAVFQTLGFFLTILDLPFRLDAWTALGRFLRVALFGARTPEAADEAADSIEASLSLESMDALSRFMEGRWFPTLWKIVIAPLLPLILLNLFMKFVMRMWMLFFLGWPLALLWRTRRYLADSTAVQLTRNPDGLARALRHFPSCGGLPPHGASREYLFFFAPDDVPGGFRDRASIVMSLQPSLASRLARVMAQGAAGTQARSGAAPRTMGYLLASRGCLFFIFLLIAPLLFVMLVIVAMMTLGTVFFTLTAGILLVEAVIGSM